MYKLYYDKLPGTRVSSQFLNETIKNFRQLTWTKSSSIDIFLSFLGIDYLWTDNAADSDAIVILEIDSASDQIENVFDHASKTYKKSIIISTTEPCLYNLHADRISKKYPNVLYVSVGDHSLNFKLDNFFLFPFFLLRPHSLLTQINLYHLDMCNLLTSAKPYVFNHLSNFWSPNKYHMHYTIKNYFEKKDSALISYKPINWPGNKSKERLVSNLAILEKMKLWIAEINKRPIFYNLYPYEDYINRADPTHIDHYRIEKISGDTYFDINNLSHPLKIYTDTHLSLVTEVIKGRVSFEDDRSLSYNYISEKTVQSILHGHLFVVNASDRYHTDYLQKTLGVELYDEIFDFADIEDTDVPKCQNSSEYLTAYKIISQLNDFRPECIFDNAKSIAEKIQFNRNLLINPGSKLRSNLKQSFIDILEHYRNLKIW